MAKALVGPYEAVDWKFARNQPGKSCGEHRRGPTGRGTVQCDTGLDPKARHQRRPSVVVHTQMSGEQKIVVHRAGGERSVVFHSPEVGDYLLGKSTNLDIGLPRFEKTFASPRN